MVRRLVYSLLSAGLVPNPSDPYCSVARRAEIRRKPACRCPFIERPDLRAAQRPGNRAVGREAAGPTDRGAVAASSPKPDLGRPAPNVAVGSTAAVRARRPDYRSLGSDSAVP